MMAVTYAAPVAQWIEHPPSKWVAVSSSLTGRAKAHNPVLDERHAAGCFL